MADTNKLSTLIRQGCMMSPELTRELNHRRNLNRGAFAQVVNGVVHTNAIGAIYQALWNDAPTNVPDAEVCQNILKACGIADVHLRSVAGVGEDDPHIWYVEHEEAPYCKPVLYQIEKWGDSGYKREEIAELLEEANL